MADNNVPSINLLDLCILHAVSASSKTSHSRFLGSSFYPHAKYKEIASCIRYGSWFTILILHNRILKNTNDMNKSPQSNYRCVYT